MTKIPSNRGIKKLKLIWTLAVIVGVAGIANGAGEEGVPLPGLDAQSAKGLQMECLVAKTNFTMGEAVNIRCIVTNTTDSIKPIGWHPSAGAYFCCVQAGSASFGGLLPLVIPQSPGSLMMKSQESRPGYIIFLPPYTSLDLILTYRAERPEKFKGQVVYTPVEPTGGITDEKASPRRTEWIYSNTFEYEVNAVEKK